MSDESSGDRGSWFGPRTVNGYWAVATPPHAVSGVHEGAAGPAGTREDERIMPLSPPDGTDGAGPCERGAPAIWLLPCILGGGLIWATILLAVL